MQKVREVKRSTQRNRLPAANADGAPVLDALKGALAGAIGTLALDAVTWFMWDREDPGVLEQERQARPGGMDPAHVVANKLAHAVGSELAPRQPHPAGIATHFAIGVAPAALYGVARKHLPQIRMGRGLLFGLTLFLVQDEIVNWLTGLSGAPTEYPGQAHLRGLAGHVAYGVVTDAMLDLFDRGG